MGFIEWVKIWKTSDSTKCVFKPFEKTKRHDVSYVVYCCPACEGDYTLYTRDWDKWKYCPFCKADLPLRTLHIQSPNSSNSILWSVFDEESLKRMNVTLDAVDREEQLADMVKKVMRERTRKPTASELEKTETEENEKAET